jgi:protein-S-isoprenylcysteine O-methyltransferase Ste14
MALIKVAAAVAAAVIAFSAIAGLFHAVIFAGFSDGDRWTASSYLRTAGILLVVLALTVGLLYACKSS